MLDNPDFGIKAALAVLEKTGLARDLAHEELTTLAKLAREINYPSGTAILREDSRSRDLYLIKKGRISVQLRLSSEDGREELLYSMRDGQLFGELALLDGSPRSATVRAEDDVVVYKFDYDELLSLLEEQTHIGYIFMRNIAQVISARVRNTNMLWRNSLIW